MKVKIWTNIFPDTSSRLSKKIFGVKWYLSVDLGRLERQLWPSTSVSRPGVICVTVT
jgi:hypothetical protein